MKLKTAQQLSDAKVEGFGDPGAAVSYTFLAFESLGEVIEGRVSRRIVCC